MNTPAGTSTTKHHLPEWLRPSPLVVAVSLALGATPSFAHVVDHHHASVRDGAGERRVQHHREVVFIDAGVPDMATLRKGLKAGTEVILLKAGSDGVEQIADALHGRSGLQAIHIISHGASGQLQLGNMLINSDNLPQHEAALKRIHLSLASDADILLYGCDVAKGSEGKAFIDELAKLTGAHIAASDNTTGNLAHGGDWDLEIRTGNIATVPVLASAKLNDYAYTLANQIVSNGNDAGAGSLRQALIDVGSGETITFNSVSTVTLSSGQLQINKSMTIDGGSGVTIDAGYSSRILNIISGTVNLNNLTITKGLVSGNGGDYNSVNGKDALGGGILVSGGTVTINHSAITLNRAAGGGGNGGGSGYGYGGGGGGGFNGVGGGNGGSYSSSISGSAGIGGTGGIGGNAGGTVPAGKGGSTVGGAGGSGNAGAGGTAGSGSTIGGGGGGYGSSNATAVGRGGNAFAGMYIASGATVYMANTTVTNNLGAGGGGSNSSITQNGAAGGNGLGGIQNQGTFKYQSSTVDLVGTGKGNYGAGGHGGDNHWGNTAGAAGSGSNAGSENLSGSGTFDANWVPPAVPTTTIASASFSVDSGVSSTDFVTQTAAQTISGTLSTNLAAGETVLVSTDNGSTYTAATATVGQNTWSLSGVTLAGSNTLKVKVHNSGGDGTIYSQAYVLDTVAPALASAITISDTALKVGDTATVTFTFTEKVSGFSTADVTVANGTLTALSTANGGSIWTATLTPTAATTSATNMITLDNTGYTDVAGNQGSGSSNSGNYSVDTVRPTLASAITISNTSLKIGSTATVTFVFTESVTGFTVADVTVPNAVLSNLTTGDGGITWTATLTPNASTTAASNVLTLDKTGVMDLAGNIGSGSSTSANYAVDTARPALASSITISDTALKVGDTATVTFTFTEAVTGFTTADVTTPNGVLSGLSSADGGITWTATLTPNAATTAASNVLTVDNTGITDLIGNAGTGSSTSGNYAVDTVRPALASSIIISNTSLKIGSTATVTFVFTEAVTGFTAADVTVPNGALSNLTTGDGGITWTATLTPNASATAASNLLTLDKTGVFDLAGNAGTGSSTSSNYAVDTVRPALASSISISNTNLSAGSTATVTFTFTEAVTGFNTGAVTVPNGTLSGLSSSDGGITWTATLTPSVATTAASNVLTLNNTAYTDLIGNAGAGSSTSGNYAVNTLGPTINTVSVPSNGTYGAGQNLNFTVTTSGNVTVTGTPRLVLTIGGSTRYATFVSGSGTSTLTFRYTVQPGDNAAAGITVGGTLDLNGGTILDGSSNALSPTLNSVGSTASVNVDTTAPAFSSISPLNNGYFGPGGIGYSLSEAVSSASVTYTRTGGTAGSNTPQVCTLQGTALNTGAHTVGQAINVNGCTSAVTLVDGTIYTIDLNATDAGANAATTSSITGAIFDSVAPAIAGGSPIGATKGGGNVGAGYQGGDFVTINFSEPVLVSSITGASISVSGGHTLGTGPVVAAVSPTGGYASSYTITLGTAPTLAISDTLTFNAAVVLDRAGNQASAPVVYTAPSFITAPGLPTAVVATGGNGSASIAFSAPASNGGSPVTGYTVTSNPGGFTSIGCTASPCTVNGLSNGTAYTFTVTATNVAGTSGASAVSNVITPAAPPSHYVPGSPTIGLVTPGRGQLTVAFTPPKDNGSAVPSDYTVTCTAASGGSVVAHGSVSPITVTGLSNGVAYTCNVTATNIAGTGLPSANSSSVTVGYVVSVPPGTPLVPVDDPAKVLTGVPTGTLISDNGVVVLPKTLTDPVVLNPASPVNAVIALPDNTPVTFKIGNQTFTVTPTAPNTEMQVKSVIINGVAVLTLQIVQGQGSISGSNGQILGAFAPTTDCGGGTGYFEARADNTQVMASVLDPAVLITAHLDSGAALFHYRTCLVTRGTISEEQQIVVYQGEQVVIDKNAQMAKLLVRSADGLAGDAGDAITLPAVSGVSVGISVPHIDKGTGRLPPGTSLQDRISALTLPSNGQPSAWSLINQDAQGRLRFNRNNLEMLTALPMGMISVQPGRPDGLMLLDNGNVQLTVNETIMTFSAQPRDIGRLAADGRKYDSNLGLTIVADGSLRFGFAGKQFAMQPDWSSYYSPFNVSLSDFSAGADSVPSFCHNADGWQQCYYPVAADLSSLQAALKQLDGSATAVSYYKGPVTIVLQGHSYTLQPDWELINTPAAHQADAWWVENGKVYLRGSGGVSQGFVVR